MSENKVNKAGSAKAIGPVKAFAEDVERIRDEQYRIRKAVGKEPSQSEIIHQALDAYEELRRLKSIQKINSPHVRTLTGTVADATVQTPSPLIHILSAAWMKALDSNEESDPSLRLEMAIEFLEKVTGLRVPPLRELLRNARSSSTKDRSA